MLKFNEINPFNHGGPRFGQPSKITISLYEGIIKKILMSVAPMNQ